MPLRITVTWSSQGRITELLETFEQVMTRIQKANLIFSKSKENFFVTDFEFLGYSISDGLVSCTEES